MNFSTHQPCHMALFTPTHPTCQKPCAHMKPTHLRHQPRIAHRKAATTDVEGQHTPQRAKHPTTHAHSPQTCTSWHNCLACQIYRPFGGQSKRCTSRHSRPTSFHQRPPTCSTGIAKTTQNWLNWVYGILGKHGSQPPFRQDAGVDVTSDKPVML